MRKLIYSLLILISLSPVRAEEQLALSSSLAEPAIILSNARNIPITPLYDSTLDTDDLWQRLRGGFAMPYSESSLISRHEQWYAHRPDYVERMMKRAQRYLYYITCEVERRGMPAEIALLPMIESAFNPGAYSTAAAAGIWQFMPATGKDFGMRQNWWYDGRRDIMGATSGALDYLEKLHNQFGDWDLALAAYNWGEGSVQRAQERNRRMGLPTRYASLQMPDETRNYVPKLIAIKNIVANPERYGLNLANIPNRPYFASISTGKHIDVELASQLAEISREEFLALNPAHNRPIILQGNNDFILLPIDKIDLFRNNLENYDKPLVSWQVYRAKKGESLDHLAPRFGLTLEKLKSVNSLSARANLNTGDTLLVPLNSETEESEDKDKFEAVNLHLHPPAPPAKKYALKYPTRGSKFSSLSGHHHASLVSRRVQEAQLRRPAPRFSHIRASTLERNKNHRSAGKKLAMVRR